MTTIPAFEIRERQTIRIAGHHALRPARRRVTVEVYSIEDDPGGELKIVGVLTGRARGAVVRWIDPADTVELVADVQPPTVWEIVQTPNGMIARRYDQEATQ